MSPPVPELPVADVERAQRHYRDDFGFEIGWLTPDEDSRSRYPRGHAVIFLTEENATVRTTRFTGCSRRTSTLPTAS